MLTEILRLRLRMTMRAGRQVGNDVLCLTSDFCRLSSNPRAYPLSPTACAELSFRAERSGVEKSPIAMQPAVSEAYAASRTASLMSDI